MIIIVTGHSLGAGVASIVAHLFKREFPKLDVQFTCFHLLQLFHLIYSKIFWIKTSSI